MRRWTSDAPFGTASVSGSPPQALGSIANRGFWLRLVQMEPARPGALDICSEWSSQSSPTISSPPCFLRPLSAYPRAATIISFVPNLSFSHGHAPCPPQPQLSGYAHPPLETGHGARWNEMNVEPVSAGWRRRAWTRPPCFAVLTGFRHTTSVASIRGAWVLFVAGCEGLGFWKYPWCTIAGVWCRCVSPVL